MGVDAVGSAGHKGQVVLALHHLQVLYLGGQHNGDLVHLVGQHPVQHRHRKGVAYFQLVQMGKQLGTGQTPVRRDDRMGAFAAHRQAGALQMSCAGLQHRIPGAVVDGQLHVDPGNGDVAHDAGAGDVQCGVVGREPVRVVQRLRVGGNGGVEAVGGVKPHRIVRRCHAVHLLGVVGHGVGLMPPVDRIADGGVQHHRKPQKEHEDQEQGAGFVFLHGSS